MLDSGITGADDHNTAMRMQREIHAAQKAREPVFERYKAPIRFLASHVDELNRVGRDALDLAKRALGREIGRYESEQEEIAAKERRRLKEKAEKDEAARQEREAKLLEKEALKTKGPEKRELLDTAKDVRAAKPTTPHIHVEPIGSQAGRRRQTSYPWHVIGETPEARERSKLELLQAIVAGHVVLDAVEISDSFMKSAAKHEKENMNKVNPVSGRRPYPGIGITVDTSSTVTGR